MAALEQVAANLDEKTEEVESRIKENSRIIAEMDQKTVSSTRPISSRKSRNKPLFLFGSFLLIETH